MLQAYRTGRSGVWPPLHHPDHQTHEHRAGRENQEPQQPAVLLQTYWTDLLWRQKLLKDGKKTLCSQTFSFSLSFPWRSTEKLEPTSIFTSLHLCLYSVVCCLEPKWSTWGSSSSEETVLLQPETSWKWRSVGHSVGYFCLYEENTLNIFFKRTMGMIISLLCCCFIVLIFSA